MYNRWAIRANYFFMFFLLDFFNANLFNSIGNFEV